MPSKIEKLKATLSRSRARAKKTAERSTNMALTVGSCYAAGYATGRYKEQVTVGETEAGAGGVNSLTIGGGLIAAGAAVDMVPSWLGAIGVGLLGGTLAIDGLEKGQADAVST